MEKSMEIKVVKKNQPIHFPEMMNSHIYFLKKGSIKIFDSKKEDNEIIKYVIKAGNIFGELLVNNINQISNELAITLEDSLICFMNIETMRIIVDQNPEFNLSVHKLIGYHVYKIERCLGSMVFKNSRTRIVDFLIDMAKKYGTVNKNFYVVKNFLTLHDIAKLTATTRQTVTSTLNDLQHNHLIDYNHHIMEISPEMLR